MTGNAAYDLKSHTRRRSLTADSLQIPYDTKFFVEKGVLHFGSFCPIMKNIVYVCGHEDVFDREANENSEDQRMEYGDCSFGGSAVSDHLLHG